MLSPPTPHVELKGPPLPTVAQAQASDQVPAPSVPAEAQHKETKDMSHTLAALFDQKEGSMGGFGMGGLLGIRGGIPKLPSFRVSPLLGT